MNDDIKYEKTDRAPLKRSLSACCRDCGTTLIGFYSKRSKMPLHVECPKCGRHYDKIITPPATITLPR